MLPNNLKETKVILNYNTLFSIGTLLPVFHQFYDLVFPTL